MAAERRPYYRPDLDGLRAVAILSVVLFHAGLPHLKGGFVGVDVFFVLSGFLISSILYREMEKSTFTFRSFYERRARRILPALTAVLVASYVLGLLLLTPRELRSFCAQVLATLGCGSNIFFWRSTGYFDAHTELKPLLMTWSLGVEEQFYLIFPVLVVALYRKRRRSLFAILIALSALSFFFSIYQTATAPQTAFYMLPSRWWELGAGTLLGAYRFRLSTDRQPTPKPLIELASICGLLLLLASIAVLKPTTPFPGLAALPPVLGAVLLIFAEGSWVNRHLLAARPMVAVGLVSYSWYLWHWPLLSFARISGGGNLPVRSGLFLSALSLFLAVASYFLVERPFRKSPARAGLLWRYAALTCAASLPAVSIIAVHGWPGRYQQAAQIEADARPPLNNPCLLLDGTSSVPDSAPCVPAPGGNRPVLAVLGDSHAGSLANALMQSGPAHGWAIAQYTKVSCTPTGSVGVYSPSLPNLATECPTFFTSAVHAAANNPEIHTVLLTGLWTDWVDPDFPARHYNPPNQDLHGPISQEESYQNLETGLDAVVQELVAHRKRVILAMDVPEIPYDPLLDAVTRRMPARNFAARLIGAPPHTSPDFRHLSTPGELRCAALLQRIAIKEGAEYLDLSAALCSNRGCAVEKNGIPLYYDSGHLSIAGAEYALRDADLFGTPSLHGIATGQPAI